MADEAEQAVERVIATMRNNLGEPLTIDDMARAALFSKFHFSRLFLRVTGISPGRFLSAIRLQKAKELLVSTSMNVADISLNVGYTSVGTFSTRFSRSVGLSPTTYRRLGGYTVEIPQWGSAQRLGGVIRGHVRHHRPDNHGLIFLGLFQDRIPEGRPIRCAVLDRPGPYRLDDVPPGDWFVLVHSVATDLSTSVCHTFAGDNALTVGNRGPIRISAGDEVTDADVQLRTKRSIDPPVLLALLDARKAAMAILAEQDVMPRAS